MLRGLRTIVEKAICQHGRKIVRWSEPRVSKVVDVFSIVKHESRLPRWVFTNPDTPDGPIESLGIDSLHQLYREFWALVHEYKGSFVRTSEGRIHRKKWREAKLYIVFCKSP